MELLTQKLIKSDELESKIRIICSFNNIKCEFKQGRILNVKNTNISFIEPHRVDINIKNKKILLIYFDKNNLFLYNRRIQIDTKQLDMLIKEIKKS